MKIGPRGVAAIVCAVAPMAIAEPAPPAPVPATNVPVVATPISAAAPETTVIVLSWDGIRHDYPDWAVFPGLSRLERDGVRATLLGVYPSNTFPSHVSLATGTHPDTHGIVDNFFLEGGKRYDVGDADWIHAEPVWISTQRQGVNAATYFWVGSESDWRGQGTWGRVAPFAGHPEALKVRKILEWFDLPNGERPRLIMSYWAGADEIGHRRGPVRRAIVPQVRKQDDALQTLIEGLDARNAWAATTLILVSDHGMTAVSGLIDVEAALERAGVRARVYGGALARVFLRDVRQLDKAERVLRAIEDIEVYRPNALPPHFRLAWPGRNGHLVVTTEPPNVLAAEYSSLRGAHGYPPQHPDMKAAFFAMGRGVEAGARPGELRQIDLAATIAALLEVAPPAQSEGAPMAWLCLPPTADGDANSANGGLRRTGCEGIARMR